jgi:predicted metal-dependent peptidase
MEVAPVITDDIAEQTRNDILAQTIIAAQQTPPGKVPSGIWLMIDKLISPKMDWRSMLDVHIRSAQKDDYSYARISRKSFATGAILPSPGILDTIDICVAIDTSGSMSDEQLRDILSEIKGIMLTFRDFRLRVWTFDAKVHPQSFKEFSGENIDEIDEYKMYGRGGTVLEVNWSFMRKNDIEPTRLIIFTDGEVASWGDPNYCDTLFVIHGNPGIKAPWGITAHYTNDNERHGAQKMVA